MIYKLREYQRVWLREVWRSFYKGIEGMTFDRVLACAATGAGKTILASALIEQVIAHGFGRCLFLADTDELCGQAVEKIRKSTGIIADLEKAASRASLESRVVVGSIQTMAMADRLKRFPRGHFHLIIADEAHLSMADIWQKVFKHFGCKVLGITATPERSDGIPLMNFYQHLAAQITLKQMVEMGMLCPPLVRTVPLAIKLDPATLEAAENGDSEALGLEMSAYHEAIIDSIETFANDRRKVLVFHPSRKASATFSELLLKRGHAAMHVDGQSKDRAAILRAFHESRFRFLNNAQLLVKGYDEPGIDCVIPLRLTRSRTEYTQMAGRGTRLFCEDHDDICECPTRKQDFLLLDFLWQTEGHNIMGPADLCSQAPDQIAAVKEKLARGDSTGVNLFEADANAISEREEALVAALRKAQVRRGTLVDARTLGALYKQEALFDWQPQAQWQARPVTPKQLSALRKWGIDPASATCMGHASALLEAIIKRKERNLATEEQISILLDMGHKNPEKLTRPQARAALACSH